MTLQARRDGGAPEQAVIHTFSSVPKQRAFLSATCFGRQRVLPLKEPAEHGHKV